MTTITAKQLRQDLKAIIERVQAGEEILVTYRNSPPVRLSPQYDGKPAAVKSGLPGLEAFLAAPKTGYTFDPDKSFKQLYHEHLDEEYGRYDN